MGGGMLAKYELFLDRIRKRARPRILELGAGPDNNIGASVRVWKEFFPDGEIHVADIKATARGLEAEGFHVHVGNLGQAEFVRALAAQAWDFVIDDASHIWTHQLLAFRTLFPSVTPGGVFIMEDLCTSFAGFRAEYCGVNGADGPDADYFLSLTRAICYPQAMGSDATIRRVHELGEHDQRLVQRIDMVSWIPNACIVVKK
jgi:hypothetical protein